MSTKREAQAEAIKILMAQADATSHPVAQALYSCTSLLATTMLLVSEEVCGSIKSGQGLLGRMGL